MRFHEPNSLPRSIVHSTRFMHMSKYSFKREEIQWGKFRKQLKFPTQSALPRTNGHPAVLVYAHPRKVSVGGGSKIGILTLNSGVR